MNIVKLLLFNNIYNKYYKFINVEQNPKIFSTIDKLHKSLSRDISFDEFKLACLNEDESLLPVLESIEHLDVKEDAAEHIMREYLDKQLGFEVALVAVRLSEGNATREQLAEVYEKYSSLSPVNDWSKYDISDDYRELAKIIDRKGGLQWRLPFLNQSIGGLHKGDFGFIFARTNSGKSTFVASELSFMLTQLEKPCLFFFNEEAAERMKWRIFQAFFGADEDRVKANIDKCIEAFNKGTKGLFNFKNMPQIHKREIDAMCKDLQPGLIVIDNIDKVYGFKADREDIRLGNIYTWARELAKMYCPVIAVCQAGSSAENKKWLQHTDIMSAHTSKSSEADFIIGLGHSFDTGYEDVRFLRVVKNKFKPGEQRAEVRIDPLKARYYEL
jgi:KaiC/GvpD/RAD55 family RecA-like ATPase